LPPSSLIEDRRSFWSFSFIILNDWVIEPVVVKTVSNFNSSSERVTCASGLVMKDSFLQALKRIRMDIEKKRRFFIGIKSKTKCLKEEMTGDIFTRKN
jgi:hypothetical protein